MVVFVQSAWLHGKCTHIWRCFCCTINAAYGLCGHVILRVRKMPWVRTAKSIWANYTRAHTEMRRKRSHNLSYSRVPLQKCEAANKETKALPKEPEKMQGCKLTCTLITTLEVQTYLCAAHETLPYPELQLLPHEPIQDLVLDRLHAQIDSLPQWIKRMLFCWRYQGMLDVQVSDLLSCVPDRNA